MKPLELTATQWMLVYGLLIVEQEKQKTCLETSDSIKKATTELIEQMEAK